MNKVQLPSGTVVALGSKIASAGEGTVYEAKDRPEWVIKIFHSKSLTGSTDTQRKRADDYALKQRKVGAMVHQKPTGCVQSNGRIVLAWPEQVVLRNNSIAGFVMPRVDLTQCVEIHQITNTTDRRDPHESAKWVKGFTWLHLANVAANLCLAVEVAHKGGAVIGDFNERNILVSMRTGVTLVDCDSMQFVSACGEQFFCSVGRDDYTAPELLGRDLRKVYRESSSDLFPLAVHIHQLLLDGTHPFHGVWKGPGEKPPAAKLAKEGIYAGSDGSPLLPQRTAPPLTILPEDIRVLFHRAFMDGAQNPSLRPKPQEWREALVRMIGTL